MRRRRQLLAGTVEQSAVRRMGDGTWLHGGVDHHRLKAAQLHHACAGGCLDTLFEQPLADFLADALTLAHEARRITPQVVAEVLLVAEVLSVWVLDPVLHHVVVR